MAGAAVTATPWSSGCSSAPAVADLVDALLRYPKYGCQLGTGVPLFECDLDEVLQLGIECVRRGGVLPVPFPVGSDGVEDVHMGSVARFPC